MNALATSSNAVVQINPKAEKYFGIYGGFFVPDPFTPALEDLSERYTQVISEAEFQKLFQKALKTLNFHTIDLGKPKRLGAVRLYYVPSQVSKTIIAGYVALGKLLGRQLVAGVRTRSETRDLATASKELGVALSFWLNIELGKDAGLVKEIKELGVEVDIEKTSTLFDDPEMYAFQRFIGDPMAHLFVPLRTNVGPYPFPSITGNFAAVFGKTLKETTKKIPIDGLTYIAPGYPGTEMISLIRAGMGKGVHLVTVEMPRDRERPDCYCGAYTRVAMVGKSENVLSPELLAAWEAGVVERIQAKTIQAAIKMLNLKGDVIVIEEA